MDVDYSLKDVGVSNNSGLVFLDNTMERDKRWNPDQFHYHEKNKNSAGAAEKQ